MAIPTKDKFARRFLGDTATMTVHDVDHEDPTPTGCLLDSVLEAQTAVNFEPDRLRQAFAEGFSACPKCLYRYETRRGLLQELLYEPLKNELKKRKERRSTETTRPVPQGKTEGKEKDDG